MPKLSYRWRIFLREKMISQRLNTKTPLKYEILNSKHETSTKYEIQNVSHVILNIDDFGFVSNLGFRASYF